MILDDTLLIYFVVKLEQKSLKGNLKCWFQVRIIWHQRCHKHMIAPEVGNAIGHDINSAGWKLFSNRSGESKHTHFLRILFAHPPLTNHGNLRGPPPQNST